MCTSLTAGRGEVAAAAATAAGGTLSTPDTMFLPPVARAAPLSLWLVPRSRPVTFHVRCVDTLF